MKDKIIEKKLLYNVIVKKDPESFGGLYDRYVAKIYRFVYIKVNNREDAEDITGDVFLKTWNYLANKEKEQKIVSFSGLVFQIARNSIVDYYRKRAVSKESFTSLEKMEYIVQVDTNLKNIEIDQEMQTVLKLLKQLKEEYREVVVLRYINELSIAEIARIMEKRKTTVRVLLHRAIKKIKDLSAKL